MSFSPALVTGSNVAPTPLLNTPYRGSTSSLRGSSYTATSGSTSSRPVATQPYSVSSLDAFQREQLISRLIKQSPETLSPVDSDTIDALLTLSTLSNSDRNKLANLKKNHDDCKRRMDSMYRDLLDIEEVVEEVVEPAQPNDLSGLDLEPPFEDCELDSNPTRYDSITDPDPEFQDCDLDPNLDGQLASLEDGQPSLSENPPSSVGNRRILSRDQREVDSAFENAPRASVLFGGRSMVQTGSFPVTVSPDGKLVFLPRSSVETASPYTDSRLFCTRHQFQGLQDGQFIFRFGNEDGTHRVDLMVGHPQNPSFDPTRLFLFINQVQTGAGGFNQLTSYHWKTATGGSNSTSPQFDVDSNPLCGSVSSNRVELWSIPNPSNPYYNTTGTYLLGTDLRGTVTDFTQFEVLLNALDGNVQLYDTLLGGVKIDNTTHTPPIPSPIPNPTPTPPTPSPGNNSTDSTSNTENSSRTKIIVGSTVGGSALIVLAVLLILDGVKKCGIGKHKIGTKTQTCTNERFHYSKQTLRCMFLPLKKAKLCCSKNNSRLVPVPAPVQQQQQQQPASSSSDEPVSPRSVRVNLPGSSDDTDIDM